MLEKWQAGERQRELSFLLSNFWLPDAQHSLDSMLSGCRHQTEPEKLSVELKNAQRCNRHQVGQTVAHWETEDKGRGRTECRASKQDEKASKGPGPCISTGILSSDLFYPGIVKWHSQNQVWDLCEKTACKTGGRGAIKGDFRPPSNRGISMSQKLVKRLSGCLWQEWLW